MYFLWCWFSGCDCFSSIFFLLNFNTFSDLFLRIVSVSWCACLYDYPELFWWLVIGSFHWELVYCLLFLLLYCVGVDSKNIFNTILSFHMMFSLIRKKKYNLSSLIEAPEVVAAAVKKVVGIREHWNDWYTRYWKWSEKTDWKWRKMCIRDRCYIMFECKKL